MHACNSVVGVTSASKAARQTILLVDDDPDVRDVLGEFLMTRGYAVASCANGSEALEYLRHGPQPQVILLDLQMPVMDGYELREALAQDAILASIPIVVISDQATLDRSRIEGVDLLPKPFKVDKLVGVIEKLR